MAKDKFSGNLFEKPAESSPPEFEQNDKQNGEQTDAKGNVYDSLGQLIREAQSEDLKGALKDVQKQYPKLKITPDDPLVQQYILDRRRGRGPEKSK